ALCGLALVTLLPGPLAGAQVPVANTESVRILQPDGTPTDPNFFPIAVWVQSPKNASRYKAAGINLYVGLWRGPTPEQIAELEKAGMPVICGQNERGLAQKSNPLI